MSFKDDIPHYKSIQDNDYYYNSLSNGFWSELPQFIIGYCNEDEEGCGDMLREMSVITLVKESLHSIKYSGRKEYLYFYGKCIAKAFYKKFIEIKLDYFVPVPIHKKMLIKRNYNQASVLAHVISDELKIIILIFKLMKI